MEKINLLLLLLSLNIIINVHTLYKLTSVKKDMDGLWDQIHILTKTIAKKLGELKSLTYINGNKNKKK
tara:strand:+ start:1572 stop:1775 length:204 start_codon:yes stop_codon:yes gene_type:complete